MNQDSSPSNYPGNQYPGNRPQQGAPYGALSIESLVYSYELLHGPGDYDRKVTGENSAIITYRKTGKKLVITDISSRRSRFEG